MRKKLAAAVVAGLLLSACGSNSNTTTSSAGYEIINGTIVYPVNATSNVTNCPNVPAGYAPLSNAAIGVALANQTVVTVFTDACGQFHAQLQTGNYILQVHAGNVVYTIPEDALEVASNLIAVPSNQTKAYKVTINKIDVGAAKVYLTITDSTGKALIGIPPSAVTIKVDGVKVPWFDWIVSASSGDPASVAMVMDASGSMGDIIANTTPGDKYYYAALAAQKVVEGKNPTDEYSFVIFDDSVNFLNSTFVNGLGIRDRSTNSSANVTYPADGFTTDVSQLLFAVDIYNPHSPLYDVNATTYPYYLSYYNWGGATALIDASYEGVDKVSSRANTRRFVIVMTDGQENSSYLHNDTQVVNLANQNGVTIYTIGIGDNYTVDTSLLKEFANGTGGLYYQIDPSTSSSPLAVLDPFLAALSNISFQYEATVDFGLYPPGNHTLSIEINYLGISGNATAVFQR